MLTNPPILLHLSKLIRRCRSRRLPLYIISNLHLIQLTLKGHPAFTQIKTLLLQLLLHIALIYSLIFTTATHCRFLELYRRELRF